MNPTEIHLRWAGMCPVTLVVVHAHRALTSGELHSLADTVTAIEQFRDDVAGLSELEDA